MHTLTVENACKHSGQTSNHTYVWAHTHRCRRGGGGGVIHDSTGTGARVKKQTHNKHLYIKKKIDSSTTCVPKSSHTFNPFHSKEFVQMVQSLSRKTSNTRYANQIILLILSTLRHFRILEKSDFRQNDIIMTSHTENFAEDITSCS